MKVKELIEELKKCDPNLQVFYKPFEYGVTKIVNCGESSYGNKSGQVSSLNQQKDEKLIKAVILD